MINDEYEKKEMYTTLYICTKMIVITTKNK